MRLIHDKGAAGTREAAQTNQLQDYLERTAKYVPVEIIAAFMALRALVPGHGSIGGIPTGAEIAVYVALVVLTPLYLLRTVGDVPRKQLQVLIATASFVVWSYAIGGPFFWTALEALVGQPIVYPGLAAAILVVWSLSVGLVNPVSPAAPASGATAFLTASGGGAGE